jgi:hypothetical protein
VETFVSIFLLIVLAWTVTGAVLETCAPSVLDRIGRWLTR